MLHAYVRRFDVMGIGKILGTKQGLNKQFYIIKVTASLVLIRLTTFMLPKDKLHYYY